MATVATADQVAQVLPNSTAVAFAVSEISIRLRSARHSHGRGADRGSIVAVLLGVGAGVLVALWCAIDVSAMTIPGGWATFGLGLALMWAGIALRQWAVLSLGRLFTVMVRVSTDQAVVDRGPYRWVRHPSYTGLLLTLVGLGIALSDWLSLLALMTLPTLGLMIRIRVEEEALLSTLGEPYRAYAEHRPRLVPYLW